MPYRPQPTSSARVSRGIFGSLGLIHFDYAPTLDLLETDIVRLALTRRASRSPSAPSHFFTSSLVDLNSRPVPVALFAVADRGAAGRAAHALLIQNGQDALNSARRLAVMPQSFHQPLFYFSDEAQLSATIERELE
jgi:hypothetical protein